MISNRASARPRSTGRGPSGKTAARRAAWAGRSLAQLLRVGQDDFRQTATILELAGDADAPPAKGGFGGAELGSVGAENHRREDLVGVGFAEIEKGWLGVRGGIVLAAGDDPADRGGLADMLGGILGRQLLGSCRDCRQQRQQR